MEYIDSKHEIFSRIINCFNLEKIESEKIAKNLLSLFEAYENETEVLFNEFQKFSTLEINNTVEYELQYSLQKAKLDEVLQHHQIINGLIGALTQKIMKEYVCH